ncbi:beta ketoadipyl CoA thiolase, th2 [Ancistrocladus abbreviatus]
MRLLLRFAANPIKTFSSSIFRPLFFLSHPRSLSISYSSFSHHLKLKLKSESGSRGIMTTTTTSSSAKSTPPSIGTNNEVGISRRFWIKLKRESIFAMYTPFVLCLAAGNLKLDTFRHYIAQDVHFLRAFAQAYERAEEYADDDDAKISIAELRRSVVEELKMHDSVVQEWGFDLVKECPLNSATVKYTDFLLATSSGKIEGVKGAGKLATPFEKTKLAAYTLGAMTPCMRLYAFIGKELQQFLDLYDNDHPYKKWIDNYSSEGFQASALQTEDLLDKLSVSLTGEELDVIEKLYQQAMKLEIEFFAAQPLIQSTVVPLSKVLNPAEWHLVLFSDFDLTCTLVDSSAILAEIAILTALKSDQNQSETQILRMSSSDLRNTWGVLSKQYTEEYEQCIEDILKSEKVEKFSHEGLSKALELLSDFEKRANTRVIESGVLKGINLEDVKKAGEHMLLQDGCTSFFQKIVQNDNLDAKVHLLSYCWCGDLIRSAFSSGGLHVLNIHANEFKYEESISTGEIVQKVETPSNKVQAFSEILENYGNDKKKLTVYVGDSVGDLLCLLKADIGIVIGTSPSLRRVGDQFGVSFVPLFQGLVKKQKEYVEGSPSNWKGLSGVLYTASSWAEIHAFILGP